MDCCAQELWSVGQVVDFSEAAEYAYECGWCDGPTECFPRAVAIDTESESFDPGSDLAMTSENSPLWPEARSAARELRSKLTSDPGVATRALRPDDLWRIRDWAGTRLVPVVEEIRRAITADPENGLDEATLGDAVWCIPDRLGPSGTTCFGCSSRSPRRAPSSRRRSRTSCSTVAALHPGTLQLDEPTHGPVVSVL